MNRELHERREGGVLTLTVDRPDDANRLNPALIAHFASLVEALREDTATNVVVLTGAGSIFSMGILNPVIRASMSKDDVVRLVRKANALFDALEALPQVVIGALNGKAGAGGVEMALACDMRFASADASMVMPEATWGGFPGAGAPVRLPMIVGKARALELIATGREIDAQEMKRLGIVLDVFPSQSFADRVAAVANQIASSGPLAVRGAKRIIMARQEPGFRAARELSDSLRHALEWSADVDEGMAAHKEGRKPRFTGK